MAFIVNRKVWGAKPPSRLMPRGTYPESTCFIHHEAGGLFRSEEPASEAARMREIQHYDMTVRNYADIPYSFGMFPSGRAYEGRDYVWDDSATGGSNGTSISIVFPGNYELQSPTPKSLDGCAELIVFGIEMGQLTRNCTILGHREAPGARTACPGKNLMDCLPGIRARVTILLGHPTPSPVQGGLMSVLALVMPGSKAGPHKDGRFAFFSHTDKTITAWNGASLAGDHDVVPPTTDADSANFVGQRAVDVPVATGQRIIGLMYGGLDTSLIVACSSDGATFAYTST